MNVGEDEVTLDEKLKELGMWAQDADTDCPCCCSKRCREKTLSYMDVISEEVGKLLATLRKCREQRDSGPGSFSRISKDSERDDAELLAILEGKTE